MDTKKRHQELAEKGLAALKRSQEFAWKRAVETRTPFIVYKDGKIVDLLEEENTTYKEDPKPTLARIREEPEPDS